MKNNKLLLATLIQTAITVYLQRGAVYFILLFLTLINLIYITKILDSSHKVYKLSSLALYLTVYSGIVIQIMAYLENSIVGTIPYVITIPAFIGFLILFIVVLKEVLKFVSNYSSDKFSNK